MKKLIYLIALLSGASMIWSCSKDNLESFKFAGNEAVSVFTEEGQLNLTKTNDYVQLPLKAKLNAAASKSFDVELKVTSDTIKSLLEQGLLKDVVALPNTAFNYPNTIKFQFGKDTASFGLTISRTAIERIYGKKFGFAYQLTNPGKGNQLGEPNTLLVTLDSKDLLEESEIHYLSITNSPGNIILASSHQNYATSPSGIDIPLGLSLTSFPGKAFTVEVRTTPDSIQKWIQQDKLPSNTVPLPSNEYNLTTRIQVPSNKSSADFGISIPWDIINKYKTQYLALTIYLLDPTLHVLNPAKNYTTILIDCKNVIEFDVTGEAVLTVNRDNGNGPTGGEGSLKFVDNLTSTKFLQGSFTGDLQCTLTFPRMVKIGAYTLTSGNDAIERDPKSWFLEASLDGINWVTIDTRADESFPNRIQTRRFNVQKAGYYQYYRLNITENVGSSLFQCSEWRMIEFL